MNKQWIPKISEIKGRNIPGPTTTILSPDKKEILNGQCSKAKISRITNKNRRSRGKHNSRKKSNPYQRNPNNFYRPEDESSDGFVTKSNNFDPTSIANSEGNYPCHMPLKEVKSVIEEGLGVISLSFGPTMAANSSPSQELVVSSIDMPKKGENQQSPNLKP